MTDKDFEVLQTALSPEVSESEEQVCCLEHYLPVTSDRFLLIGACETRVLEQIRREYYSHSESFGSIRRQLQSPKPQRVGSPCCKFGL